MRQAAGDFNDHIDNMFIANRDAGTEVRTECGSRISTQAFQARQVLVNEHPSCDSDICEYAET